MRGANQIGPLRAVVLPEVAGQRGPVLRLVLVLMHAELAEHVGGDEAQVFDAPFGKFAIGICYDLRFPELWRHYAVDGARIAFVPAEWPQRRIAHWRTLLPARAIENQVYIIAPGQFGKSPNSFETHGHSMIIDPWGKILAELPDGAGVITAEVDLDYLTKVRTELPCLDHRKLV